MDLILPLLLAAGAFVLGRYTMSVAQMDAVVSLKWGSTQALGDLDGCLESLRGGGFSREVSMARLLRARHVLQAMQDRRLFVTKAGPQIITFRQLRPGKMIIDKTESYAQWITRQRIKL